MQESNGKAVQESNGKAKTVRKEYEDFPLSKDKRQAAAGDEPDLTLEVDFKVREIDLEVEGLRANVSIVAELADLVKLSVGAEVSLDRLTLTVNDVEAESVLKVRLDQVRAILDKALDTIGENPEILQGLVKTEDRTPEELGCVVGLVQETVGDRGAVSQLTRNVGDVGGDAGETVGQGVGQVGQTANQGLGVVTDLPGHLLEETVNEAGQTVQRIVDDSGNVIERRVGLPRRSNRRRSP